MNATAIALAKVRAQAIREAMVAVSEHEDSHNGEHFGPGACLGCLWRFRLDEFANDPDIGGTNG